ncbi:MAG: hypothetical protein K0Q73_7516 [Paenibacillus sp.]|nr:hypothetical protein [Paenibacillus sp.]
MATVGASLKLFDQFSSTLTRAQQVMNSTLVVAERLKHSLQGTISLHIVLDSTQAMSQAAEIRSRIQSRFGQITARIRVELPIQLTSMFQNLQTLVMRLISAVRQLRIVSGSNAQQLQDALQRIARLEQQILDLQGRLNNRIREGANSSGGLLSNLKGIASAYLAITAARIAMSASDDYISTQARISLVNDGGQTPVELQAAIFAAAKRARGDYVTMAGSVGKMGLLAGDAFGSNKELIAFTELMQKSFKVSGASTQESQAGMYQLTQAMAAGKLQGDEFRSIMENAPMLADAIAKFTGKTKGDLKDMSADGTITANIIKGALFSAGDDINKKFQTMPKTFGDIFMNLKNQALQSFGPVIEKVSMLLNSPGGGQLFQGISNGIVFAANAFSILINLSHWFFGILRDNWPAVRAGLISIALVISSLMINAILKMGAAWLVANWPILLVIAAIGLVIYILQKCGVTADQVVGLIAGSFMYLVGTVWNTVALIWNIFASLSDFLINLFIDPVYAIKKLIYDLAMAFGDSMLNMMRSGEGFAGNFMRTILQAINKALEGFNWLTEKVNGIFGTEFKQAKLFDETNIHAVSDSLKNVMDMLEKPVSEKAMGAAPRMGQKNLKNEFDYGYNAGAGLVNRLSGFGILPDLNMDANTTIGKVNEVGKINDTVDISNEDLKVMRELAEMKSIQNFITLTPTVQVTGDIHNHEASDVEDMVGQIVEALKVEVSSSIDGVISS